MTRSGLLDIIGKFPQCLKSIMAADRVIVDYQDPDILIK
jgi:hypothetical protein